MFIYNGQEMGRGPAGLEQVVSELRKLPQGARLLIYPAYRWAWFSGRDVMALTPFQNYAKSMEKVCMERKLVIVQSDWNHLGRPTTAPLPPELP